MYLAQLAQATLWQDTFKQAITSSTPPWAMAMTHSFFVCQRITHTGALFGLDIPEAALDASRALLKESVD